MTFEKGVKSDLHLGNQKVTTGRSWFLQFIELQSIGHIQFFLFSSQLETLIIKFVSKAKGQFLFVFCVFFQFHPPFPPRNNKKKHIAWRKVQFEKTSSGVLFKFRPLTAQDVPWAATKKPPASSFVMGTQIRNASCVCFFLSEGGVFMDLYGSICFF